DKLPELDERICALSPGDLGENGEAPLQTKTIPAEIVRQNLAKWTPSMHEEYDSLVVSTPAVSPLSDPEFTQLVSAQGGNVELIPGKAVFTQKAFSGRFKTRVVGCGNFQTFTTREQTDVYASGAPCESIRLLVRRAAIDSEWILGSVDITPAQEMIAGG
ncbi:GIP, partial [Symbiodinium pilosum]